MVSLGFKGLKPSPIMNPAKNLMPWRYREASVHVALYRLVPTRPMNRRVTTRQLGPTLVMSSYHIISISSGLKAVMRLNFYEVYEPGGGPG